MLVMTFIYDSKKGDLYKEFKNLKDRFKKRNILLGLSESLIRYIGIIFICLRFIKI